MHCLLWWTWITGTGVLLPDATENDSTALDTSEASKSLACQPFFKTIALHGSIRAVFSTGTLQFGATLCLSAY